MNLRHLLSSALAAVVILPTFADEEPPRTLLGGWVYTWGDEFNGRKLSEAAYPNGSNPFHHPAHLILNTAVGGKGTWPEAPVASQYPCRFEIDYVRYYTKQGE